MGQLDEVSRHRLMNREVVYRALIILPEVRMNLFFSPLFRQWGDRIKCLEPCFKRTGRVAVGKCDTSSEFRHDNNFHRIGGQGENLRFSHKVLSDLD